MGPFSLVGRGTRVHAASTNNLILESGLKAKPAYRSRAKLLLIATTTLGLTACEGFLAQKTPAPEPQQTRPAPPPLPDANPIRYAEKSDIIYAQNTLNKLGYAAGPVDGIWGPQSARAIRNFEKKYGLTTANGLLSNLNLFMLEKISNTSRTGTTPVAKRSNGNGITAKLDASTPLEQAPQLVILERSYAMLAKPNPFSEKITDLSPGTGVYVLGLQEGWYEIESDRSIRGYVKAD